MKSLVVEDGLVNRHLLVSMLDEFGRVDTAGDGVEALAAVRAARAKAEPYDLICLDILMPRMDGQTALREIRALEANQKVDWSRRTRILMTTSVEAVEEIMRSFHELSDDYLTKPIQRAVLHAKLRELGLIDRR